MAAGVDVRQIADDRRRLVSRLVQAGDDLVRPPGVPAVDHDARADRGELVGDTAPDPRRRAGDERNLVGEGSHRTGARVYPSSGAWPGAAAVRVTLPAEQ